MLILGQWSLYYQQLPMLFLPSEPKKNRPLCPCCPLSSRDEATAHQVEIGVPGFRIAHDGQILNVALPLPTRGTDLSPGSLSHSRFREAF